jgi:hypothetical protein
MDLYIIARINRKFSDNTEPYFVMIDAGFHHNTRYLDFF